MKRNVFALFEAVAVLLTATMALTLSRGAPFATGIGTLKCYQGAMKDRAIGLHSLLEPAYGRATRLENTTTTVVASQTECEQDLA